MIELTGADESLIEYVTDRPGHDRRYSLSSDKLSEELGWEAAGPLRRGPRADRRTGTATTRSGGGRSAPASTASTTRSSTAGRSADAGAAADQARGRRPARADRPRRRARLHGRDLQPRRLGRARRRGRVRPAQPLALARRGPCAASTSRPSPARRSWSAAPRGEILDVAVDLRRDSPTYGRVGGRTSSTTTRTASSSSRSASATASPSSARSPTSPTCSPASTTRRPRPGIAWDDPDVGVEWPVSEPLLSERDKTAPHLAEVADSLPFEYR